MRPPLPRVLTGSASGVKRTHAMKSKMPHPCSITSVFLSLRLFLKLSSFNLATYHSVRVIVWMRCRCKLRYVSNPLSKFTAASRCSPCDNMAFLYLIAINRHSTVYRGWHGACMWAAVCCCSLHSWLTRQSAVQTDSRLPRHAGSGKCVDSRPTAGYSSVRFVVFDAGRCYTEWLTSTRTRRQLFPSPRLRCWLSPASRGPANTGTSSLKGCQKVSEFFSPVSFCDSMCRVKPILICITKFSCWLWPFLNWKMRR